MESCQLHDQGKKSTTLEKEFLNEPPGSFSHRGAHPEERSDEGSHAIPRLFEPRDEESG